MDPNKQIDPAGSLNEYGGTVDELDVDNPDVNFDRGDSIDDVTNDDIEETPKAEPEDEPAEEPDEESVEDSDKEPEPEEKKPDTNDDDEEPVSGNRVPVSRLNKEIEKRKKLASDIEALQAQIEELRNQSPAKTQEQQIAEEEEQIQLDSVLTEALEKAIDGDVATAAKTIAELIEKTNRQAVESATKNSTKTFENMTAHEKRQALLEQEATRVVEEYSVLNAQSENFDQGMLDEVLELRDAYIASGKLPHEALRKASEIITKNYGVKGKSETVEEPAEPATEPKKRDIKKNVDAAIKTPPKSGGEMDSEKRTRTIDEIPEDEFEKLSKEDLRRMRGDIL